MLVVAVVASLVGFSLVALLLSSRNSERGPAPAADTAQVRATPATAPATPAATPAADDVLGIMIPGASETARPTATPRAANSPREESFLARVFESEEDAAGAGEGRDWLTTFARVTVRLTLAALLTALLAFRPRRFSLFYKRNPFVAQTQILLAVVASALMMIVGDSAARAFGIFAAVSLVRFRTNIKDPKEITVLLVSLALGLATGVGRWELAIILAFFVLLLLWGLEYREPEQVTRAMELTVKTKNVDVTQDVLLRLFRKYDFDAEVRTLDRPDGEGEVGCIMYHVSISPFVSTDRLSEEILTADPQNVDSVEWDQQKNTSYFYQ
jgi:uncharacterized membrane protein YhiD involved in acid resistance